MESVVDCSEQHNALFSHNAWDTIFPKTGKQMLLSVLQTAHTCQMRSPYHVLRKRTSAREVERTQTQIVLNLSGMLYFAPVSTLYTTRLFFFSNTTLTVYVSININLVKQCPIKTLHENHYKGLHSLLILVILSKKLSRKLTRWTKK